MTDLNAGQGRCQATARLLIKPVRAAIELGAAQDVLVSALRAVHHANRHGSVEDFIAVAFPSMRLGRDTMLPGHELELIGSPASLSALVTLDGLMKLSRRGMIETADIGEIFVDVGTTACAYVRDRSSEKHTPGWIRRNKARAERRGKPLGKDVAVKKHDPTLLTLRHGEAVLHIREVRGVYGGGPLTVSTYGLSSASAPAILPVLSDAAGEADDAA
ncbi:hypothetical protein [Celeribacter sp.]|uniref:hypothetical protein n=1 Tax=Celeribacter sp. TaxID=1890673 RepID=UPI003A8F1CD3